MLNLTTRSDFHNQYMQMNKIHMIYFDKLKSIHTEKKANIRAFKSYSLLVVLNIFPFTLILYS